MSAKPMPPNAPDQWPASDEIDLAQYLRILRARWQEIVLVTVVAVALTAVGVLLYRQFTPPVYEANASVAIVRTSTEVVFDDRFTTTSEQSNLDVNSRRTALVALVKSGSIAQQVIAELGDTLPADLRSPAKLLEAVTAEMATATGRAGTSDLIQISVTAESPELAAEIANAWARAYVQQVNAIYGQVPDDMLGSVEAQLVETQAAYSTAQAALETFLASSDLDALTRQAGTLANTISILQGGAVNALQANMNSLVGSYGSIVQTYVAAQAENQVLAFRKEQEGQRARVAAYLDAVNAAEVDTFTGQSDSQRRALRQAYDQWLRTSSLLGAARTLQQQIAGSAGAPAANQPDGTAAGAPAGSPSRDQLAASALALQVLNLQLVNAAAAAPLPPASNYLTAGTQPDTPAGAQQNRAPAPLQVQLDGSSIPAGAADLQRQVDATVASLEGQLASLEQTIAELNQAMLSGESFADLNAEVPAGSPLAAAIAGAYPALFQSSTFSATALAPDSNALFAAGQAQAAQFLALAENGSLPTANSPDAPLAATIAELEAQLRTLQGQIEVERARSLQFTEQRDLAWESVQALSNKQAELQLARAAANSEVRLSSLAVPLDQPVPELSLALSLALAAVAGLLLGVVAAFFRHYAAGEPLIEPAQPHAIQGKIGAH